MEGIRWAGKKRRRSSERHTKPPSKRSSTGMVAERSERRKRQLWADRHLPGSIREDFRPRDVNKQLPDGDSDVQYVRNMDSLRNIPGLFTEGNFYFEMQGGES